MGFNSAFNPLNAELNPICHLLALLGAHQVLQVSGVRIKAACVRKKKIDIGVMSFVGLIVSIF